MGHSTSSGRATGGTTVAERAEAAYRESAARVNARIDPGIRAINRAKFESDGNGQWTLDVEGHGGGQILDETGSSRDPMYGRGGKLYSARTWNADYDHLEEREQYFTSLSDAKAYVRQQLQNDRRRRNL